MKPARRQSAPVAVEAAVDAAALVETVAVVEAVVAGAIVEVEVVVVEAVVDAATKPSARLIDQQALPV